MPGVSNPMAAAGVARVMSPRKDAAAETAFSFVGDEIAHLTRK